MTAEFRPATTDDVPALAALVDEAYRDFRRPVAGLTSLLGWFLSDIYMAQPPRPALF
jgi:hypothetical protein